MGSNIRLFGLVLATAVSGQAFALSECQIKFRGFYIIEIPTSRGKAYTTNYKHSGCDDFLRGAESALHFGFCEPNWAKIKSVIGNYHRQYEAADKIQACYDRIEYVKAREAAKLQAARPPSSAESAADRAKLIEKLGAEAVALMGDEAVRATLKALESSAPTPPTQP